MVKVSVIIPTYNRAQYIAAAIDSVLGQTYPDYEIIVVDDGSTDNTRQVLSRYGERIRYIYQKNSKEGAARNNGIRHAQGEFVALLDSDDLWLPHKLERDVALFAADMGIGVVYSLAEYITSDGKPVGWKPLRWYEGDVLEKLALENFVSLSTAVVRRACFEEVGYFNEDRQLSGSVDWEMWMRLAARYRFACTGQVGARLRVHPTSMMSTPGYMEQACLRALELAFANPALAQRLAPLKPQIYANIYTYIALGFYTNGDMRQARHYLRQAVHAWPRQIVRPKFFTSFMKTLAGPSLSRRLRGLKWRFHAFRTETFGRSLRRDKWRPKSDPSDRSGQGCA